MGLVTLDLDSVTGHQQPLFVHGVALPVCTSLIGMQLVTLDLDSITRHQQPLSIEFREPQCAGTQGSVPNRKREKPGLPAKRAVC